MPETDKSRMKPEDVAESIGLLTRLPVALPAYRGVVTAWAWPLAGVLVALAAALAGGLMLWAGFGPGPAALVAVATQVILTGAMHEDGLADCCDGFWGAEETDDRLDIMKDSRIGTYGVLALVISVGLRWLLLAELFAAENILGALVTAAVLSRAAMAAMMSILPNARTTGLSAGYGRPLPETMTLAVVLALIIALLFSGFAAIAAAVAVLLAGLAWSGIAKAKIGGQTGDVLGATQQLSETAALMALAVLI